MGRMGEGLIPRFELYETAVAAGYTVEAFAELPLSAQAAHIAHHRAHGWLSALEAWDAHKRH